MEGVDREAVEQLLDRHQRLRDQGTPLVSAVGDDSGSAIDLCRAWAWNSGRRLCVVSTDNLTAAIHSYLIYVSVSRDLVRDASVAFSVHRRDSADEIRRRVSMAGRDAELLAEEMATLLGRGRPQHEALFALMRGREWIPERPEVGFALLRTLVPPLSLPALAFRSGETPLAQVAPIAAEFAMRLSSAPLLIVADAGALDSYMFAPPEARAKAMLREGFVRFSPAARVMDEKARSRAEKELFRLLENDMETRGLFQLNVKVAMDFGHGAAEIDLLAERLQLAVEVDGYYHFRDSENYRRDRRKDILLQRHGLWVVRCLAEDVHEQPGLVLQLVRDAVADRRRQTKGQ